MQKTDHEYIYGIHAVESLLDSFPEKIKELYCLQGRHDQRMQSLIKKAERQHIGIKEVSRKQLDEITHEQHQGVIAKCQKIKHFQEADIELLLAKLAEPAFILVLDEVQDPHNLGACLRSANAAGVHMVIAPKDNAVGLTPAVRKVASGAAEITPFIQVTNLARTIKTLKELGIWFYGASGQAEQSLFQTDLKGPIAIVLGAEGKGLRRLTEELCDFLIKIPMSGTVESLNVSVATGICVFEAVRQRNNV